jgi:hypothetical protein
MSRTLSICKLPKPDRSEPSMCPFRWPRFAGDATTRLVLMVPTLLSTRHHVMWQLTAYFYVFHRMLIVYHKTISVKLVGQLENCTLVLVYISSSVLCHTHPFHRKKRERVPMERQAAAGFAGSAPRAGGGASVTSSRRRRRLRVCAPWGRSHSRTACICRTEEPIAPQSPPARRPNPTQRYATVKKYKSSAARSKT